MAIQTIGQIGKVVEALYAKVNCCPSSAASHSRVVAADGQDRMNK